jgi:trypsin
MSRVRNVVALAALAATLAVPGTAQGIVGGSNAAPGEFPEVAEVVLGQAFLCTGTLIDSTHVLTAGHCGSLTGAAVSTPISWPPPLIDVRIGSNKSGAGEPAPVKSVSIPPEYLGLTSRNDLSILELQAPSSKAPTKVAGAAERSIWAPGVLATIAGWGVTKEDGDLPDTLQKAQVPITTDQYCADAYRSEDGWDFDPETMVCAGYPQGGVDTCQGDSGGPLFGHAADGSRRVVGVTSWGDGCAQPGRPGVYARVADTKLREWVRSQAPGGVSDASASPATGTIAGKVTKTKTKAALASASGGGDGG